MAVIPDILLSSEGSALPIRKLSRLDWDKSALRAAQKGMYPLLLSVALTQTLLVQSAFQTLYGLKSTNNDSVVTKL